MSEIDPITGLPKEILTVEKLGEEDSIIKLYSKKANFDKVLTIIDGIPKDSMKNISRELKRKLACGGTIKDGHIELQGNHKEKVKKALIELGFDERNIETL